MLGAMARAFGKQRTPEEQRRADLAKIHIAKKQLGLSDQEYKDVLLDMFWSDSSADLDEKERAKLLARFKEMGFKIKKKKPKRKPRRAPGIAEVLPSNHAMVGLINHLIEDIKWDRPGGQSGYIKKIIQKPWPKTIKQASKVIEALKGLKATQQRRAAHG